MDERTFKRQERIEELLNAQQAGLEGLDNDDLVGPEMAHLRDKATSAGGRPGWSAASGRTRAASSWTPSRPACACGR
jgi:hypothetical protein